MLWLEAVLLLVFQDSWLYLFFTHKQPFPSCTKTTKKKAAVLKQSVKVLHTPSRKKRRKMTRWMMLHNDSVESIIRRVSFLLWWANSCTFFQCSLSTLLFYLSNKGMLVNVLPMWNTCKCVDLSELIHWP